MSLGALLSFHTHYRTHQDHSVRSPHGMFPCSRTPLRQWHVLTAARSGLALELKVTLQATCCQVDRHRRGSLFAAHAGYNKKVKERYTDMTLQLNGCDAVLWAGLLTHRAGAAVLPADWLSCLGPHRKFKRKIKCHSSHSVWDFLPLVHQRWEWWDGFNADRVAVATGCLLHFTR